MKIGLRIIGIILILVICYFLYQIQLGAIPFLIASFVLFYFVYRLIVPTSIQETDANEPGDESTTIDMNLKEK